MLDSFSVYVLMYLSINNRHISDFKKQTKKQVLSLQKYLLTHVSIWDILLLIVAFYFEMHYQQKARSCKGLRLLFVCLFSVLVHLKSYLPLTVCLKKKKKTENV